MIEALIHRAPPAIRTAYRRYRVPIQDECVRMARLAHDILRILGVESEPVDCTATAWNREYDVWAETGVDSATAYMHTNDPMILHDAGLDISHLFTHLVVVVPATKQMVDLAAWQLSRPHRGIQLPSALALPWNGDSAQHLRPRGSVRYRRWCGRVPSFEDRPYWTVPDALLLAKHIARRIARSSHTTKGDTYAND